MISKVYNVIIWVKMILGVTDFIDGVKLFEENDIDCTGLDVV